jgi:hypothetical protein
MGKRVALALAAALALAGVVLIAFGVKAKPPVVQRSATAFFNFDRPSLNAHTSPAVAFDPARPATVAVVDRIDSPAFSCSVSISTDSGTNWAPVPVPLPADAPNCWWPDVGYDDHGQMLVLYTATGGQNNLPVGAWVQRFTGAKPDGPPVKVAGNLAFQSHMAVEGADVLIAYVQATPDNVDKGLGFTAGPNPIMAVRSSDGGRTFAAPVTVSEPGRRVAAPNVELGPNGKAVVLALDLRNDVGDYEAANGGQGGPADPGSWGVVAYRTGNGGETFSPAVTVANIASIPQRIIVNLAPVPGLARDRTSGRFYATWDAGRGDARDVFVASSPDNGATWSTPVAVVRRPGTQNLPAVSVAPDGRVDVVYYDRSEDPTDRNAAVSLSSSWNEGRTFATASVSGRDFDSRLGYASSQGIPVLSSQLAVLSAPGRALAFWADTRRGNQDDDVIQLGEAIVHVRQSGGRRWPVAVVGLVLLSAGAIVGLRTR